MTTRIASRWTLAATLILVAVGGFTRGSGSGFGCADRWPLCQDGLLGGLLPRAEFHMIIEWSHRWLAALVGVLAITTAIVAWRRARRWIAWVAISGVVVIGIQAWVGRLVVVNDLDADLVSLHLVISMTVAALLTVVVVATTPASGTKRNKTWAYLFGTGAAGIGGNRIACQRRRPAVLTIVGSNHTIAPLLFASICSSECGASFDMPVRSLSFAASDGSGCGALL